MPLVTDAESPKVTVFVPTWNGGKLFEEVLDRLATQETTWPYELLAIDSGSRDGTLDLLKRYPIRVIQIPNKEFDHGLTRNLAIREARGEFVVLTVQDATPDSTDWLATMISNFDDPEVAGVYCHQIPRPNCSPFLRIRLRHWLKGGGEPIKRKVESKDAFWKLHPRERFMASAFDNVASAVRRSVALELPFVQRNFGEDVTWAKGAILAGHAIVQEPRVAVIHSHDNTMIYEFRRVYMDHRNLHNLVGLRNVPTLRTVLQYTVGYTKSLWRELSSDPDLKGANALAWKAKAVPFAFLQTFAQYLGSQCDRQGRRGIWKLVDRIMGYHV